jgi:hypothetical protein
MSGEAFGDHIQPHPGFVYPEPGDEITAIRDYQTPSLQPGGKILAGDTGTVRSNRKPGTFDQFHGWIGLVVHFDRVRKTYPSGLVISWDQASEPGAFAFRKKPSP